MFSLERLIDKCNSWKNKIAVCSQNNVKRINILYRQFMSFLFEFFTLKADGTLNNHCALDGYTSGEGGWEVIAPAFRSRYVFPISFRVSSLGIARKSGISL